MFTTLEKTTTWYLSFVIFQPMAKYSLLPSLVVNKHQRLMGALTFTSDEIKGWEDEEEVMILSEGG